jgi:asparagine synthase (glutamine-hydrolysing)
MCGITGIVHLRQEEMAVKAVRAMNSCIAHRGPDAEGLWSNHEVALGHRRLSIIDTSAAGNQPFISSKDEVVVVFNGEIYNYLELRSELEDQHVFQTKTDTEVLVAAYRRWGIDAVHRFVGMFGFALYDIRKQELFIVRDRLGVKPIYYAHVEGQMVFASELRALFASGLVRPSLSAEGVADYLRYQTVHAPATMVKGVSMLLPGHWMHVKDGHITQHKYWDPIERAQPYDPSVQPQQRVLHLLESAVELRMRADVPFGAFLSGGIDSSAIVGLMSRVAAQRVKTFSITFREKDFDEGPYSRMIARKFATDHTEIELSVEDFLDDLPHALQAMDHPSGDGPNTYTVSKKTRAAGVKMALSGLGGDEVFAGYAIFQRMLDIERHRLLHYTPRFLREWGASLYAAIKPGVAGQKIAEVLRQEKVDFKHVYPLHRQVLMDPIIAQVLRLPVPKDHSVRLTVNEVDHSSLEVLSKVSVAEMKTYMQNVLLRDTDQMSMAHALEVRVPFLDHRLVEYVLGLPDTIKEPTTPKRLLTEALGDLLPREVIDRPKMGFTFPWPQWMRGTLRSFCEEQLMVVDAHPLFVQGEVMKLWKRFLANDPGITWSRLWPLVVLGHWMRVNHVQ